jgi:hypothetical protein
MLLLEVRHGENRPQCAFCHGAAHRCPHILIECVHDWLWGCARSNKSKPEGHLIIWQPRLWPAQLRCLQQLLFALAYSNVGMTKLAPPRGPMNQREVIALSRV